MEEFELGDIEAITALSTFLGIALTVETCRAVSEGLVVVASYFE